ncbi:MAG: recombinase family protein [Planctomycetota bacterium]|nr:MAG: recombinase family protein [Planctomycetota bacterium]
MSTTTTRRPRRKRARKPAQDASGTKPRRTGQHRGPRTASAPGRHVAIYLRVSSTSQALRSQEPDLQRWADAQDQPVRWYRDKASGGSMARPGWDKLTTAMHANKLSAIVVWRVDRLGRTASGLTTLFDELQTRKVNLVSLKDGVDLSTAAGRMLANVLASVAQFEREVRSERQAAGIAAAKAAGKRWGGSKPGVRKKVTDTQIAAIKSLRESHTPIKQIAAAVGLSRPTVYSVLAAP